MRVQNRKRIHIEPIKSPSPDIANRNIITDTRPPLQDIHRFNQSRSGSKSPKINRSLVIPTPANNINLNNLLRQKDRQIQYLKHQNQQLNQRLSLLEAQQAQTKNIIIRNSRLTHQVQLLKQKLEASQNTPQRPYSTSPIKTNPNNTAQKTPQKSSVILKEFNDRIQQSAEQNKKLEKSLHQQMVRTDFLIKENQLLKNQNTFYKKQSPIRSLFANQQIPQDKSQIKSLDQLPEHLKRSLEQMFKNFQIQIMQKNNDYRDFIESDLKDMEKRIEKVKFSQAFLQEKIKNRKHLQSKQLTISPPKQGKNRHDTTMSIGGTGVKYMSQQMGDSNQRSNLNESDIAQEDGGLSLSNSPIRMMTHKGNINLSQEIQRLRKQNQTLNEKINYLTVELRNLQMAYSEKQQQAYLIDKRLKQVSDLQLGLNQRPQNIKMTSSQVRSSGMRRSEVTPVYTQNANQLQNQVHFYKEKFQQLESELMKKLSLITNLQQSLQVKDCQIEELNNRLQMANSLYEDQMPDLKKVIDQEKLKNSHLQLRFNELERQLTEAANKYSELEQRFEHNQIQLEKSNHKLIERDNFVFSTLKEYISILNGLRSNLSSSTVEQNLGELEHLQKNQITFEQLRNQNANIVQDIRSKLVQKDHQILKLEKDKRVLECEVRELKDQQKKMQQLIYNFNLSKQTPLQTSIARSRASGEQHQKLNPNSCYLKECIKNTVNGLQGMERKIKNILKQ